MSEGRMVITLNDGTELTIEASRFQSLLTDIGTLIAVECQKARSEERARCAQVVREWIGENSEEETNRVLEQAAREIEGKSIARVLKAVRNNAD